MTSIPPARPTHPQGAPLGSACSSPASIFAGISTAGTTGVEFQALHTLLQGWAEGYLGRALAIAAFIVGAVIGFARGHGVPGARRARVRVVFAIGPGIINGLISGVI